MCGIVGFMVHTEQKSLGEAQLTDKRDRMISCRPIMPASSRRTATDRSGSQACGLPVIPTDRGSLRDTIVEGETGFLKPPGSAHAIADRIVSLIKNREIQTRMAAHTLRVPCALQPEPLYRENGGGSGGRGAGGQEFNRFVTLYAEQSIPERAHFFAMNWEVTK